MGKEREAEEEARRLEEEEHKRLQEMFGLNEEDDGEEGHQKMRDIFRESAQACMQGTAPKPVFHSHHHRGMLGEFLQHRTFGDTFWTNTGRKSSPVKRSQEWWKGGHHFGEQNAGFESDSD